MLDSELRIVVRAWCIGFVALWALLFLSGCTLFKSVSEKAPKLPVKPAPQEELVEAERQVFEFAEGVLGKVEAKGAEPQQPLVTQGKQAVRAGRTRIGNPSTPVPLPPTLAERSPFMDALLAGHADEMKRLRKAEEEFEREMQEARNKPLKTTTSFGILSPWTIFIAFFVIVLVVVGGSVGIPVIKMLVGGLFGLFRQAKAFRRVLRGVESFKDDAADEPTRRLLGQHLVDAVGVTSRERETIGRTKREMGL